MTKPVKDQVDTVKKAKKFKDVAENPVYRTVAGGFVGAGIGYALKPKLATKAVAKKYPKKKLKDATSFKGRASSLTDSLFNNDSKKKKNKKKNKKKSGLFSKDAKKKDKRDKRDKKAKKKPNKKQYQSLKSENESLQQRLQFLEDKFDQYAASKKRKKSLFGRK